MIESTQISHRKLVLAVDDQEICQDALSVILEEDYDVLYASNGKEALELMKQYAHALSLVLLDLFMPVMDGFEVMEYVREDEILRRIPIIVLTSEKSAELRALKLGAADFIMKPLDLHEVILARVARIIELSEGRQLISSAEHDKITGLYTSNFFFEYADRLQQFHPEMHLDAIVVNIEQFHTINALNGRQFGDQLLRIIGEEIQAFLEEIKGIACRYESDHFYIFCEQQYDCRALLERFQKKVNNVCTNVNIHLRMGVEPWRDRIHPILLFDRARAACNMVRGNFQNPLMIYSEDMRKKELYNQRLLGDLLMAAERKHLEVYYQPKYDIQCDPPRLSSAEALIRWNHPEFGMISPGDFISLFERNGLISIVDTFVWQEAAKQIAAWRDKYHFMLPVSVNLSRADVFDPTLVDRLQKLILENGLDFKNIKLEVTESAYTDNAFQVLDVIHRLRELGFEIEMDDFGSGYSSLNMLSEMPVDVLKMDMNFIRNIENSDTDRRLVTLSQDIAKYLEVPVVAEGVETEKQLEILRSGDCALVQGFYFSHPLPANEFERLIQREIDVKR